MSPVKICQRLVWVLFFVLEKIVKDQIGSFARKKIEKLLSPTRDYLRYNNKPGQPSTSLWHPKENSKTICMEIDHYKYKYKRRNITELGRRIRICSSPDWSWSNKDCPYIPTPTSNFMYIIQHPTLLLTFNNNKKHQVNESP